MQYGNLKTQIVHLEVILRKTINNELFKSNYNYNVAQKESSNNIHFISCIYFTSL